MSLQQRIASIPILGYCLKCAHDLIFLPVIRRDLHAETQAAELRMRSEIDALKSSTHQQVLALESTCHSRTPAQDPAGLDRYLPQILDRVSQQGAQIAELELRLNAIPEGLRTLRRGEASTQQTLRSHDARLSDHATRLDEFDTSRQEIEAMQQRFYEWQEQLSRILQNIGFLEQRLAELEARPDLLARISALEERQVTTPVDSELQPLREELTLLTVKVRQLESVQLSERAHWTQSWDDLARSLRIVTQQVRNQEAQHATAHEELERALTSLHAPLRDGAVVEGRV